MTYTECLRRLRNWDLEQITKQQKKEVMEFLEEDIENCFVEMINNGQDHRYIETELLDAFIKEGELLHPFYEFAKNQDNDIIVCFRGISKQIMLYKYNHKVIELSRIGEKKYRAAFDFNHARYTINPRKVWNELKGCGFECNGDIIKKKINKNKKCIGGESQYVYIDITCDTQVDEINKALHIIKTLIDDFFKEGEKQDYFYEEILQETKKKTLNLKEKKRQQEIYKLFHNEEHLKNCNNIYVYDLEFSQSLPSKSIVEKVIKEHKLTEEEDIAIETLCSRNMPKLLEDRLNSPDFLGIELDEHGNVEYLVFGEIKSKKAACVGKSGIEKHIRTTYNYCRWDGVINNRLFDAEQIIKHYKAMGDISESISIKWPNENAIKRKIVVILTDEAIEEYNSVEKEIVKTVSLINSGIQCNNCSEIKIEIAIYDEEYGYQIRYSNEKF